MQQRHYPDVGHVMMESKHSMTSESKEVRFLGDDICLSYLRFLVYMTKYLAELNAKFQRNILPLLCVFRYLSKSVKKVQKIYFSLG